MHALARSAVAIAATGVGLLALTGCSSGDAAGEIGGSRAAYEALLALGARCDDPLVNQQSDLPYVQIACGDLEIDWVEDDDAYADLWRADCAAVLPSGRDAMAAITLVVGDRWLLRGRGDGDSGPWPDSDLPAEAAEEFDGRVLTAAQYCEDLGAWS